MADETPPAEPASGVQPRRRRAPRRRSPAARRRPRPPAAAAKPAVLGRPDAPPISRQPGRGGGRRSRGGPPAAQRATQARGRRRHVTAADTRAWMGLAWGAFSAASAAALAATGRFMFPNVLNEPPQQFKAGFPERVRHAASTSAGKRNSASGSCGRPRTSSLTRSGFYALLVDLHAPRVHAELPAGGKQIQVPVPRQRLSRPRHQLRRSRAAAARARAHRARRRRADPGRQEPAISNTSSGSGQIRSILEGLNLDVRLRLGLDSDSQKILRMTILENRRIKKPRPADSGNG